MKKIELGAKPYMMPMPTTLVGTECNSKANYRTVAFCSMVQVSPPIVAIGLGTGCYTGKGIRETGGFSINIPSEEMVKETDYCGLVSGKNTDKSTLFQSFFGQLGNVPMITECPLNLECKLNQVVDLGGGDDLFLGEIVQVYCNEDALKDGEPNLATVKPILFTFGDNKYWGTGRELAPAWSIGKELQRK